MALDKLVGQQLDLGPASYFEPSEEATPGNQIVIGEGWFKSFASLIYVAQQNTTAFVPVITAGNVRWDLVYLDKAGTITVTAGIEQTPPVADFTGAPATPSDGCPLAYVKITEAGTVVVTNDDITDLRPQFNVLEDRNYASIRVLTVGRTYRESLEDLANNLPLQFQPLARTPVDNKIDVRAGWAKGDETLTQKPVQTTASFAPVSSGANVRWDLVYIDNTGAVSMVVGTEVPSASPDFTGAASPSFYEYPLAYVKVTETASVLIDVADITDIRPTYHVESMPVGWVGHYAVSSPPVGFLEADGSEINMTTYAPLYKTIGNVFGLNTGTSCTFDHTAGLVISASHGLSNGDIVELTTDTALPTGLNTDTTYYVVNATPGNFQLSLSQGGSVVTFSNNGTGNHLWHEDFAIPDLRGEFIRGWDNGRGVDVARVFGSAQADIYGSHAHGLVHFNGQALRATACGCGGTGAEESTLGTGAQSRTDSQGGTETRPRNVALLTCIKY